VLQSVWLVAVALALQTAPVSPAPSTAWPDDHPFSHLFQNLAADIERLPSADTAWLLGSGAAASIAAHPKDDDMAEWADQTLESSYTVTGRVLGNAWVQAGASVGVYVVGQLTKSDEARHVGSDLIRAQVLNGLMTTGIKVAVGRERPGGASQSFPSGHTSAAFASASVIDGHYGWRAAAPAYAFATFVGWSRIRDRQHFLTDVIFGATIGTIVGRTVTRGHESRTWTVVPTAGAGSAGIFLVRTGR